MFTQSGARAARRASASGCATQPIPTIRAVIRTQDLDPTRRTVKWKEAEKLAGFVADGLRARLSRGSAFISTTSTARSDQ